MLKILVPGMEFWDEKQERFLYFNDTVLELEHSLASIAEWESRWHIPFMSKDEKTQEQILDYIYCMTLNDVDPAVYSCLTQENMDQINAYLEDKHSASWIKKDEKKGGVYKPITAEVIYYYMTALNIPFSCEKWNFNRLKMLIDVCSEENKPPKKMSPKELARRNTSLNNARLNKKH